MKSKGGYVYILTNQSNKVLYTGVTSNLFVRISQHRNKFYPNSFTAKYNCNKLIYFQFIEDIESAIELEKKIKNERRDWKLKLINDFNPHWFDLYDQIEDMQ